LRGLVGKNFLS